MGSMGLFWNREPKEKKKWTQPHKSYTISAKDEKTKKSQIPVGGYKWGKAIKPYFPEIMPIFSNYVDANTKLADMALRAKNNAMNSSTKEGYVIDVVMANSRLTAITDKECMVLPLNLVWDLIFAERNTWYCFMTLCTSTQKGNCEWSRTMDCLKRNDDDFTPYLRPELPLTSQLQFIRELMDVMNDARLILALRICFELSLFKDDEDTRKQFDKMLQFLFPEDVFDKQPTLFQTSQFIAESEEHVKYWSIVKEPYINAFERYDLTKPEEFDIVKDRYRAYTRAMLDHSAELADESEEEKAKSFEMIFWPKCAQIMDTAKKQKEG